MSHDGFRSNREYISHFQPLPVRVKAIKGQGQAERVSCDIRTIQYMTTRMYIAINQLFKKLSL